MYSHGFATLLLAEVHGMVRDRALAVQVRDTLAKAVQRIVTTQNDEGGWRYQANPVEQADLSVTSAQLMALRASQQASIPVAKSVMKKGLAFVRRCQVIPEGGFRYMPDNGGMGFPLSAAGLAGLHCCGVYKGDDVTAARSFVCAFQPGKSPPSINADYFLYGHYYAAQAMRQWGGKHWADWYAAIRDELCRPNQSPADRGFTRQANGAWSQPKFGAAYATALACIILQAPLNYLPIFEN
jgi:hypothetical protein